MAGEVCETLEQQEEQTEVWLSIKLALLVNLACLEIFFKNSISRPSVSVQYGYVRETFAAQKSCPQCPCYLYSWSFFCYFIRDSFCSYTKDVATSSLPLAPSEVYSIMRFPLPSTNTTCSTFSGPPFSVEYGFSTSRRCLMALQAKKKGLLIQFE